MHLTVAVLPALRARRWGWRLVDSRDGGEVETGFDYPSPDAARAAALSRVAELTILPYPEAA